LATRLRKSSSKPLDKGHSPRPFSKVDARSLRVRSRAHCNKEAYTSPLGSAVEALTESRLHRSIPFLGRYGVTHVIMMSGNDEVLRDLQAFTRLMHGFKFRPGHGYGDYVAGNKVAPFLPSDRLTTRQRDELWESGLCPVCAALRLLAFVATRAAALAKNLPAMGTGCDHFPAAGLKCFRLRAHSYCKLCKERQEK
jgi:hypothetical protein